MSARSELEYVHSLFTSKQRLQGFMPLHLTFRALQPLLLCWVSFVRKCAFVHGTAVLLTTPSGYTGPFASEAFVHTPPSSWP